MKIKEVMDAIETVNKVKDALGQQKAYIRLYVNEHFLETSSGTGNFTNLKDLTTTLNHEYVEDFSTKILNADYEVASAGSSWIKTEISGTLYGKECPHNVEILIIF